MFKRFLFLFFNIVLVQTVFGQNFNVSLSNQANAICENDSLSVTVGVQNCPTINLITWLINGSTVNSGNSLVFDTTGFQQGDVLEVQVGCLFNIDSIVVISVLSMPINVDSFILDAGPDLFIDSGATIQFQSISTADSVTWSPGFLVSNPSIIQPTTSPSYTTTYMLKGTKNTCESIDYTTIYVKGSFKIPNTFSPNGDGKNDVWIIPNINDYPSNEMIIMNRFGQELYQSRPYTFTNAWTGIFNNRELPEGVYFYILNLGGDFGVKKGTISIIR